MLFAGFRKNTVKDIPVSYFIRKEASQPNYDENGAWLGNAEQEQMTRTFCMSQL